MPVSKSRKTTPKEKSTPTKTITVTPGPGLALYHVVYAHEEFDDAAEILLHLVQTAAREHPSKPRHLYLDIEGHRNEENGFDPDMYELQANFILGFLSRWLTAVRIPLSSAEYRMKRQYEDVPDHLTIHEGGPAADREKKLVSDARATGRPVYDSETGNLVHPDGRRTRPSEGE